MMFQRPSKDYKRPFEDMKPRKESERLQDDQKKNNLYGQPLFSVQSKKPPCLATR